MSTLSGTKNFGQKIRIALRFIIFGLGGLGIMFCFTVALAVTFFEQDQTILSPFFSLPLLLVGAFMILYGIGKWGKWAYLLVFFSIPVSLWIVSLIPGTDSDKGLPVIIAAIAAYITNNRVRVYYARKNLT